LILIGHIDLLPRLFQRIILPTAVEEELHDIDAPAAVRAWIGSPPAWLEILAGDQETPGPGPATLDEGEAAVIALAVSLHADLVLIDERKGVKVARSQGLRVTGTLGLLDLAAQSGLVDFTEAAERLRLTTFRCPEALLEIMLKKHRRDGGDAWQSVAEVAWAALRAPRGRMRGVTLHSMRAISQASERSRRPRAAATQGATPFLVRRFVLCIVARLASLLPRAASGVSTYRPKLRSYRQI